MKYTSIHIILMCSNIIFIEYSIVLVLLNIALYVLVLLNILLVFFLFDLRFFKTLNELRGFFNINFVSTSLVLCFLTLAGMPPLLGFLGKLLIFVFFFFKNNLIVFFLFFLLNAFSIYFYILNLRFMVSKQYSTFYILKKNQPYLNFTFVFCIVVLNFINIFGIFFFNDIILFFFFFSC